MILGHSELKKLIKSKKIIEGLSKRDLENPEGCVFDLQLDKVFELKGKAFIGIKERETPETAELASYDPIIKSTFINSVKCITLNIPLCLIDDFIISLLI